MLRQSNILTPVNDTPLFSRRAFLGLIPAAALAQEAQTVIDIHQHTNYAGRTDNELIAHQQAMGITKTILLPAGSKYGLAAGCGGNNTVVALAKAYPEKFLFFANELPDIPETKSVLETFLKSGAIGNRRTKISRRVRFQVDAVGSGCRQRSRRARPDAFPAQRL